MREIRLPSLGAEMEEGTILEWYVKPGDRVAYGDVIALLDTEKAEIEMQAFEAGTIDALLLEVGDTAAVGDPIATLLDSDKRTGGEVGEAADVDEGGETETVAPLGRGVEPSPSPVATPAPDSRLRATPLARRLAAERGIDLSSIVGSGEGGAIIEADIPEQVSSASAGASGPPVAAESADSERRAPKEASPAGRAGRRREIIAAAMERSKREIPHYYLGTAIEIESATEWLAEQNQTRAAKDRLVLSVLLMKAVARAARHFPEMNGHWIDGRFVASERVDLGMVVSLRTGGIVVPTFRDVDGRSVEELAAELRDVVGRARAGRLRSGELGTATITLTSLGDEGVETIFGVIYPPQVAIVGFGGVHSALHVEGDLQGVRSIVRASLSADHRASDGQRGSAFLRAIAKNLGEPERL